MTPNTAREDGAPSILSRPAIPSQVTATALELLWQALRCNTPEPYLSSALQVLSEALGASYVGLLSAMAGHWTKIQELGPGPGAPVELLGDALDRESRQVRGPWLVIPLAPREVPTEVLALRSADAEVSPATISQAEVLATVFFDGLVALRRQARDRRRTTRLEAIVNLAKQWNRTSEVEPLLVHMAEAATRLLGADRASIFLWDRPNRMLVGRPALGVKGGELRIPDNRGVVGRVIQTGQPCRVDGAREPQEIDRQVDAQLGYQTRSLLCVPLRGASGELFGAFELINKLAGSFTAEDEAALIELGELAAVALENAQDRQQLLATNRQIAQEAAQRVQIIGESPALSALRSITRRVADTDLAVLILGENGTGKEVIAQAIHYWSRRSDKPFIAVNCAAIPETLAESELFGHEKGAFTDAQEARPGKFELAAQGTLFLDEIGDLTLGGQAKLLRVLEEKVLVRVGGSKPIHTDARVIAATNQNLAEMVRQKKFREDLYFRLNVVTLELPPLRERQEDVMLLADHFLSEFCAKARRRKLELAPAARQRLQSHAWPGNVRELRNLMERLAYLSSSERIEAEDLAFILAPGAPPALELGGAPDRALAAATDDFQVDYIKRAIKRCSGNMSEAATRLGLHRSNLYRKMRQLGMNVP